MTRLAARGGREVYSLVVVGLLACLFLSQLPRASAKIYWEECQVEADHPPAAVGNFYNLCIQDHQFENENFAWMFTLGDIKLTSFSNCLFTNRRYHVNNFTLTNWREVTFENCWFGSVAYEEPNMIFDRMTMTNVEFKNTVFDHSVRLIFDTFRLENVSFINCTFKGDTLFTMGTIFWGAVRDSRIMHSTETETTTGNASFTFRHMTIRGITFDGNKFVSPLRFEEVNAGDVVFHKTTTNEFHCHSEPDPKTGDVKLMTQFNDTQFNQSTFLDTVYCDMTKWRGMFMADTTFWNDAFFSKSAIDRIIWDGVHMNTSTGDCHELNFSDSYINGDLFANISVDCHARFENTKFETVRVKNFYATNPSFRDAMFVGQEYVDGVCCSTACVPLKCKCNVTDPSGNCPAARRPVNVSAPFLVCFPEDASVEREDGSQIEMGELKVQERIAIGGGEHSDVFFFGHRDERSESLFVRIEHTGSSKALRLSKGHYLYVNGRLAAAGTVRSGDRLRDRHGLDELTVLSVSTEQGRGAYAPASLHGDLLVDGVVVSSYTQAVEPWIAHLLLSPLRMLYRSGLHGVVSRLRMLERVSWEPVARGLGLPRGPAVVEQG